MDFSMLVEAEEEPDEPLMDATIFGGPPETQMGFSLITNKNDYGNDPLEIELPTPTTSPEKKFTPAPGPRPRPVQIVRSMSTRQSQPPCPFTSKAHFRAEMDKNVRDAIGESITLLKMDPRQYHPFYLRIFKYVTLGQVHGFIGGSVEDKWKIWGQYDNDAKEHFERWKSISKSTSSSVSVKIPFSGEMSPYASFVLHGTASVNGKEVRDDPTQKEERELRFRDLEETAKRICEETGKDVDLRDDLSTRLKFFQYCQTVTFPGDCVRMNEIWSKLLNGFGKSTASKSVTEPNPTTTGKCQDVSNPYFDDEQEDWIPADDDPLDQKPPLITLPSSPPPSATSSSNTRAVRTNGSEPGNSKGQSKTKRNTKKVDVNIKESRSNLINPETKIKSSVIVKKSKSSTLNGKPNSAKKITSKSNKAKVSRGSLREYLAEERRRKQNLLKWTQAQATSSTKLKKLRLQRIKQSLAKKLATNMKSKKQNLKPKATKLTSASTGEATSTSSSTSPKSRYGKRSGCPVCGKTYSKSEALWQHYKFQHLLRPEGDLNNQVEVKPNLATSRGGHVCEICGDILSGEAHNLLRHKFNIHGIGEAGPEECLQCPHCGKTYKMKDSLNMHIRQIHQGEDYRCDICNRNCQSAGKLWRHKTEEHNMTDLPLPPGRTVSYCDICGEKTLRSLLVHVKKKHPERVAEFQETERKKKKAESKTKLENAKLRKRRNRQMIKELGTEEAIRRGLAPQYMRPRTCHVCNQEFSASNYGKHLKLKHGIKYVPIKRQDKDKGEIPGERETHFQLHSMLLTQRQQQQNPGMENLPTLTWELNELIEKRKLAKILFGNVTQSNKGKVFICSFCPDVKSTILDEIRKHLISVHPETLALKEPLSYPPEVRPPQRLQVPPPTTPECPHCSENFPGEDDLLQHAEVAHPNLCTRCPECSKFLISPEAMTLHFAQDHVDNKGDEEEQVGNGDTKVDLEHVKEGEVAYFKMEYVHKRTLGVPDSDTAPVCKRCVPTVDFGTFSELLQHVKKSHPGNFFPCGVPNCGVTKFSLRGLMQHWLSFHGGRPKSECDPRLASVKQYKDMHGCCPICGTNLRVSSLDKHIRSFHSTGPNSELSKKNKEKLKNRLLCQFCDRRFYNGYQLLTHMEENHEHQVDLKRLVMEVLGLFYATRPGRQLKKKSVEEKEYSPNLRRSGRAKRKRTRFNEDDDDDEVDMDREEDQDQARKKRVTVRGQRRQQSEKRAGPREMPATKPCFVKVERLSDEVLARYLGDFSITS